ncbi:MAG: hypothetical protein NC041_10380 [Bacteroides sp.]|nr:hypothetical protein [Prevotella sp.]MCM1408879.1 restriction endonuclease [Treponema brennaborense]MCM1470860.1 hypothetical protein [Bacteroides sp.]
MDLHFNMQLIRNYHNASQIARVLTENWFAANMFCPRCGNVPIGHFENNRPVADFYCASCSSEYELKSKHGKIDTKINDGAYAAMIKRITENNNPDLFCMRYDKQNALVSDLIFIPRYFFTPRIVEKRKPLKETARRANWVGCSILIGKLPEQAKIRIITDKNIRPVADIVDAVKKCDSIATKDITARGWLLDVLNCVNSIQTQDFSLADMYRFEKNLSALHPENNNIQPKIRQQLQFLRDKGFIAFLGNGRYKKR